MLLYFNLSHDGGTRRGKYFLGWLRTTTIDIVKLWVFVSLSQVVKLVCVMNANTNLQTVVLSGEKQTHQLDRTRMKHGLSS